MNSFAPAWNCFEKEDLSDQIQFIKLFKADSINIFEVDGCTKGGIVQSDIRSRFFYTFGGWEGF